MKADGRSRRGGGVRHPRRTALTDAAFWTRGFRGILTLALASLLLATGTALAGHAPPRHRGVHHRPHRHNYLATRRAPVGLLARPGTRSVDLTVSSVAPKGAGALPGHSFKVLVQVKRIGHTPKAKVSGRLSAYLSPSAKLAAKRPASGGGAQVNVSAKGVSARTPLNFVVPIGTVPGRYFLVACVVALGRYRDTHSKNNCSSSHGKVTVSSPLPSGPITSPVGPSATPPAKTSEQEKPLGEKEPVGENPPPATPVPVQSTPPAPGPKDAPAASASTVASELSHSESTSFRASIAFLFEGPEPIQKEVSDPTVITEVAAALVQGIVTDTSGKPIGGVRVTVLAHGEYGYTDTASDGSFAMAVDGGGTLTLSYTRAGYIPIQSTVQVPVNQSVAASAAALTAYQGQADDINLASSAPIQVAQGEVESDVSGARQSTLLFSAGTKATMHLPGGSEQELTDMHVRATEFTVGNYGPEAMPGSLPPTSEYTYATAFTVDEAVEQGATSVTFSKPVITYVDNFLGFPTGAEVPSGTYEPASGQWGASSNGLVVKVLSTTGGIATLAVESGQAPATQQELSELGISNEELKAIASLYKAGDSLWRVPVTHFSSWDFNFLPEHERPEPPDPPENENPPQDESCEAPGGSTILCDSRAVAEDVPVNGTPFALHYQSDRVTAYKGADVIDIPVTSSTKQVPSSVDHIDVDVDILGHTYHHEYCMPGGQACEKNAEKVTGKTTGIDYQVIWDRLDGFGRTVTGGATAAVTVTYWVGAAYQCTEHTVGGGGENSSEFGANYQAENGCQAPARELTAVADTEQVQVGPAADVSNQGLGEWSLNSLDSYDPATGVLHSGSGADESARTIAPVLSPLAGGGNSGKAEEKERESKGEELATEAELEFPEGVLQLPNGNVLIADCEANKVREVLPDGKITTFAGTGVEGDSGDGGQAIKAQMACPSSLALAPDGSVYVTDEFGSLEEAEPKSGKELQELLEELSGRVRRIAPNGIITTVAGGGGKYPEEAAGQQATSVLLFYPGQIALGPDGSLYIADRSSGLIERVDTSGVLSLVGYSQGSGSTVSDPEGIAVNSSGEVIVSDGATEQLVRLSATGKTVIAGTGNEGEPNLGNGGPATQAKLEHPGPITVGPNGNVYFVEQSFPSRVRVITPSGTITTVAGTNEFGSGSFELAQGGIPATDAELFYLGGLFANSSGEILLSVNGMVFKMKAALAGVSDGNILVPTESGSHVDEFTAGGRELAVYDSISGVELLSFTYDSAGRLIEITDQYGRKTRIQRNGSGQPTAIIAPEGQETQLTLNGSGELETITDPDGHTFKAAYTAGQLSGFTDPRGHASAITYDSLGRLETDTDQAGGETKLSSSVTQTAEGFPEKVVRVEAPGGLTTTYADSQDGFGDNLRTITDPAGGVSKFQSRSNGYTEITLPDGTRESAHSVGDPRFGLAAPVMQLLEVNSPNKNDDVQLSEKREVQFDPDNPLKITRLTESLSNGEGEPTVTTYEPAANHEETVTTKTPEGRETVATYDSDDDLSTITEPFSASRSTQYAWDTEHGRVKTVTQGNRSKEFTYGPSGNLATVTNAAGGSREYETDADGLVTKLTDKLGNAYQFGYDTNNNLTSVRTPESRESKLAYTPVDLTESFSPEAGTLSKSEYDSARRPTKLQLPEGTLEDHYDSAGRLESLTSPNGSLKVRYVAGTGNPSGLEWTNSADKSAVETATPTFDGSALTKMDFSGPASGTYEYSYQQGRLTDLQLHQGVSTVNDPQEYDKDGLLEKSGGFTFERDQQTGLVSKITGGELAEELAYNEYGEEEQRSFSVKGQSPLYSEKLTRDDTGRITKREEMINGKSHTYKYTYDNDGRLTAVTPNSGSAEKYEYDSDSDLVSRQSNGSSAEAITYDSQDRQTALGATNYKYEENGKLAERGTDKFSYGARPGELLTAEVAGKKLTYDYDPFGRRVARTEDSGKAEQYLYGDPNDIYRLTASVSPDGTLTTYEYDDIGRLIAFKRGATTYYVATDLLGSPRVITTADGKVERELTYDAYGKLLKDTNPSLVLPIGYAGGLADPVSGLVRFGMRDYDPASGRFTERDPTLYGGGMNLYAYAGSDPIDNIDPTGTELSQQEIDETLSKLSKAEQDLASEPPPPPSLLERASNALAELRDKAADKTGEIIQACKAFINGTTPQSAIPLVEMGISQAAGEGPFEATPGFMANQALSQGAQIIQGSPAGMGSYGNSQYSQVEDGH